jgi:hypothetical protein
MTTALHHSTKTKDHEALGNASRRKYHHKITAQDLSELGKSSGAVGCTHCRVARKVDMLLTQDLRRGCGVSTYKIDLKSRGQSEEEEDMTPTRLGVLVKSRQRESCHAGAVKAHELYAKNTKDL